MTSVQLKLKEEAGTLRLSRLVWATTHMCHKPQYGENKDNDEMVMVVVLIVATIMIIIMMMVVAMMMTM